MTTFYGASSLLFFIIAQEKPLSLACLTIIQNEEMEINMNSDSKYIKLSSLWKKPYGVCIQWYLFVSALIQSYTFFSIPVFRSRGILWGFYIKLKVSWLLAFLWCTSQTSRDRDNSRRVRTQEKNLGETVRRLGTKIQSIFCAQSGAGIRLNFWK